MSIVGYSWHHGDFLEISGKRDACLWREICITWLKTSEGHWFTIDFSCTCCSLFLVVYSISIRLKWSEERFFIDIWSKISKISDCWSFNSHLKTLTGCHAGHLCLSDRRHRRATSQGDFVAVTGQNMEKFLAKKDNHTYCIFQGALAHNHGIFGRSKDCAIPHNSRTIGVFPRTICPQNRAQFLFF